MRHRRNRNCDPSFPDLEKEWVQQVTENDRLERLGDAGPDDMTIDYSYACPYAPKRTPEHKLASIPYRNGFPYVPTRDGS